MEFTLSNLLGAVLVLAGLWLIVTGAPKVTVATANTSPGFWQVIVEIFKKYPRVAIGIVLVVLGGAFLNVDFGPVLGGDTGSASPTPSPTA